MDSYTVNLQFCHQFLREFCRDILRLHHCWEILEIFKAAILRRLVWKSVPFEQLGFIFE